MNLVVYSHKLCWRVGNRNSDTFATDGGFAFQIRALSNLFDSTTLVVPVDMDYTSHSAGQVISGHNVRVVPLANRHRQNRWRRKLAYPVWLFKQRREFTDTITKADIVHTPVPSIVGGTMMAISMLMRKRLVVRHCGNWDKRTLKSRLFTKWLVKSAKSDRNLILATGGTKPQPTPNSYHVKHVFSTTLSESDLQRLRRRQKRLDKAHARLITVGRQEEGKGTEMVIQATASLSKVWPGLHLDIVGTGSKLPYYKKLAKRLDMVDHITFHGKVRHERVLQLMQQADLLCFPTASEGFPKAVVEALACGLPVVTTNVSVLPTLVGDHCGHIMQELSVESLIESVQWCLQDENRYERLSENAWNAARQYSLENWQNMIGGYIADKFMLEPQDPHS